MCIKCGGRPIGWGGYWRHLRRTFVSDSTTQQPTNSLAVFAHAHYYDQMLKACLPVRSCISFTVWGSGDADSARRPTGAPPPHRSRRVAPGGQLSLPARLGVGPRRREAHPPAAGRQPIRGTAIAATLRSVSRPSYVSDAPLMCMTRSSTKDTPLRTIR